jgi:hypothetical protein
MLQILRLNVSNVDLGVAHVAMATRMFQSVSSISGVCCKYSIWMFQK